MKVLYADDNPNLQTAIKQILSMENYDVDLANNGKQAYNLIKENSYSIILLDWMMPEMSGLEVIKQIREEGNDVPVILLSGKAQNEDKVIGLDSGADDFVTKPFYANELLARIRAILRRRKTTFNTLCIGNLKLDSQLYELNVDGKTSKLTKKEYQLVEYLIRNKNTYVSTKMLLNNIWQKDDEIFIETVWVFLSNIRKKLKSIGANVTIKASRDVGYRIIEEN